MGTQSANKIHAKPHRPKLAYILSLIPNLLAQYTKHNYISLQSFRLVLD